MNPHLVYELLPELNLHTPPICNRFIQTYRAYYGITIPSVTHYIGTFKSGSYTLTGQIFLPTKVSGAVFLVHGLFDHAPYFKHLIQLFSENQIASCLFDLPGHGLSSGERITVETFHCYGLALKNFMESCSGIFSPPFYIAGHSTGCSAITDFVLRFPEILPLNQIIFLAPLVHSAHWNVSCFLFPLFRHVLCSIPRIMRANSSDPTFLKKLTNDPLQHRKLPLTWFKALIAWNKWLTQAPQTNKKITIIQGHKDTVVDWKFSTNLLHNHFETELYEIPEGRHHLHNESPIILKNVLSIITQKIISK